MTRPVDKAREAREGFPAREGSARNPTRTVANRLPGVIYISTDSARAREAEPPRETFPRSRGLPAVPPVKAHPSADAPYWRHLRYAAWQDANMRRHIPAEQWDRYPALDTRPERLRELCKESPRDYAAIAANRKRAA